MPVSRRIIVLGIILLLLIPHPFITAGAQSSEPTSIRPPQPADGTLPTEQALSSESTTAVSLTGLKAVLVVGPIDGETGALTSEEIANSELAAAELSKNGVQVLKFYPPNDKWDSIVAASQGAHFFLYRGHGIEWPGTTPANVGGLGLTTGIVSNEQISAQLRLAPNAIVMIYACFAAGTSSTDTTSITASIAQRRVAQYSQPFFDAGAGGYYADWYGDAFKIFIADLFAGMTLGDAYKHFDFDPATLIAASHPGYPALALWLDSHYFSNMTQFNHAFAGKPTETLNSLFAPKLTVSPGTVSLLTTPKQPASLTVQIGSTSEPLTWTASENASWISLSATSGTSANPLTVRVNASGLPYGSYTAAITINASKTGQQLQQNIPVNAVVVQNLTSIFIPRITR
jgi:hypothetical protein